jgi:branched-chain amino acid transport system ATP-binding protein
VSQPTRAEEGPGFSRPPGLDGSRAMTVGRDGAGLALENLSKDFGGLKALAGVTLQVDPGERRAIIGPNGAGKTTLFRLISGEIKPTTGSVYLFGRDITRLAPHRRAALGLGRTYQITNVFPGLTAHENVMLAAQGRLATRFSPVKPPDGSEEVRERTGRAVSEVGLEEVRHVKAAELSHGEQRQLELAIALAGEPKLLLLDEPAAGLSAGERVLMGRLITGLPRSLTVVLIEHDMDLALGLVDTVTCLHYGKVIAEGSPDEIRENKDVQEVYLGVG